VQKSPPVRVLFDHGTPKGLARTVVEHTVQTAQSRGWAMLGNGGLLDRRIRHQQNLKTCRIALVVLTGNTRWSLIRLHTDRVATAVAAAKPGCYTEVEILFERSRVDAGTVWRRKMAAPPPRAGRHPRTSDP
jgi:hypothetical protein